jgi:hypothetical protein
MTETIKYCVTNQKHLVMVNILSCYVSVDNETLIVGEHQRCER